MGLRSKSNAKNQSLETIILEDTGRFKRKSRKGIKGLWQAIIEKGRSRMTVMFIPHSERRIFNFRISVFMLCFVLLSCLALIVASGVLLVTQMTTNEELAVKSRNYEESSTMLAQFMELSGDLTFPVNNLQNKVQEALMELGGDVSIDAADLTGMGGPIDEEYDENYDYTMENNTYMDQELNNLENAKLMIMRLTDKIEQINKFSEQYKEIFDRIPSVYPVLAADGSTNINSPFGYRSDPFTHERSFHTGVDIAAMTGTPIKAAANGKVVYAQYAPGNGNYIEIEHNWNFSTRYLHLHEILVVPGDTIKKGDIIGYVGSTGRSTGPHLHYEVRVNNQPIDPQPFIELNSFVY